MDVENIKHQALRALGPIKPAGPETKAHREFLFSEQRTVSSSELPPYYLVYFLLADLLGFRNLGMFEKVSWSIPLDYEGRAILVEHRKFGLGIFTSGSEEDKAAAADIARRLKKAVRIAEPYFDWRAHEAAKQSHLNVLNHSNSLLERYEFFAGMYEQKREEAERRRDESIKTEVSPTSWTIHYPSVQLRNKAKWYALATIESFFSWTEHVFILVAILQGKIITGEDVARLAAAEWDAKFRSIFNITETATKRYYDDLKLVRAQLRNVVAHGAFGKNGEAMQFHSDVGAVPLLLPYDRRARFKFGHGITFVDHDAIELLSEFIDHLWSGPRAPAKIYIQEWGLPLVLTMASSGEYASAMESEERMKQFAAHLAEEIDRSANMDF